jgi:hypothetical protein
VRAENKEDEIDDILFLPNSYSFIYIHSFRKEREREREREREMTVKSNTRVQLVHSTIYCRKDGMGSL